MKKLRGKLKKTVKEEKKLDNPVRKQSTVAMIVLNVRKTNHFSLSAQVRSISFVPVAVFSYFN